tara:strand:- start:298 stop:522 length:225 start_codon:yes stop_codon:yes gene_type:complete
MNKQNDGGTAFPVLHSIDGNWVKEPIKEYHGMSLRDYFAAKAMQGMLANNETNIPALIQASYIMADAMLKARQA